MARAQKAKTQLASKKLFINTVGKEDESSLCRLSSPKAKAKVRVRVRVRVRVSIMVYG